MTLKKLTLLIVVFLLLKLFSTAQVRSLIDFNNGWNFFSGNDSLASKTNYNDAQCKRYNSHTDITALFDIEEDALHEELFLVARVFAVPRGIK